MNKIQFLNELDRALTGMPYQDKQEIMADYVEHFRAGAEQGKSEEDIAKDLGNPRSIAKSYRADFMVERAENTVSAGNIFRAVLAVISLGFFNLVFVIGPFFGLVGALLGLWAAGAAMVVAGAGGAVASFCGLFIPQIVTGLSTLGIIGMMFSLLGVGALGCLVCIGLYYVTIGFFKLTVRYLKFNLRIINGRSVEQ